MDAAGVRSDISSVKRDCRRGPSRDIPVGVSGDEVKGVEGVGNEVGRGVMALFGV